MKFSCNNCGFSAEIPKRIEMCPMCGSSNTGCTDEEDAPTTADEPSPASADVPSGITAADRPAGAAQPKHDDTSRVRAITLSEEFFNKKPYQEEHEIAELLKELGAEEPKRVSKKLPLPLIIGGVVALVVLGAVVYVLTGSSDKKETSPEDGALLAAVPDTEAEQPSLNPEPEKPTPTPAPEPEKPAPAPVPEPEKPAPAPEPPKPAPVPVPEPPKPAPVPAPEPPKPLPAPAPAKVEPSRPVAQPLPVPPKPVRKAAGGSAAFDNFVAEGNKAIGEQRFSDAIHSYKAALKLNPHAGKIYKFLGIAYASIGNAAQACQNYRKYVELVPAAPDKAQVEELLSSCQ